jgi:hypothetical protein
METKLYNIHWYGPFTTPSEINAIQCENDLIYELYLIKGKKPRCKKSHYYCGQSITRGAGKRLFDGNHHIKEYRDNGIEEIWVGYISNPELKLQPTRHDVLLVENILIAYLNSIIGKDYILNKEKLDFPKENAFIINQWFKRNSDILYQRLREGSPSKIVPDVLLHLYKEDDNIHEIYGTNKIKRFKINNI